MRRHWRVFCSALLLAGGPACALELNELHSGVPHDALYDMCLVAERAVAVGAAGVVLESGDAGQTWRRALPFTEAALLGLACTAERRIVVGQEGLIFVHDDGGWRAVDSGVEDRLLNVDLNAGGLAIAVGGFGAVLRSRDGGETWERLSFDWEPIVKDFVEPHLYAVDVRDDGTITFVGEFELVMRSTDGGDSWQPVHVGEASLFGLHLRDDGEGIAVGQNGAVLLTRDGGKAWQRIDSGVEANLLDVWSRPSGEVVVSGIRATLRSKDGGNSWSAVEAGDFNTGWYQRVWGAGDAVGTGGDYLLAGHTGRIVSLRLD